MMAKRREKTQVIHDILSIIAQHKGSIKPTPLLRFSNLSFNLFNEYSKELVDKGLIFQNSKSKSFSITPKGIEYLELYRKFKTFLSEFL